MKKTFTLIFALISMLILLAIPSFASDGTQNFDWQYAIIFGVVGGIIAAIITGSCIIYSYKRKSRSDKYPLDRYAQLDLTHSNDIFTGSFVTRRRIKRNKK